jgi:hypothetical protein
LMCEVPSLMVLEITTNWIWCCLSSSGYSYIPSAGEAMTPSI